MRPCIKCLLLACLWYMDFDDYMYAIMVETGANYTVKDGWLGRTYVKAANWFNESFLEDNNFISARNMKPNLRTTSLLLIFQNLIEVWQQLMRKNPWRFSNSLSRTSTFVQATLHLWYLRENRPCFRTGAYCCKASSKPKNIWCHKK